MTAHSVKKNILWNLMGNVLPLVAGVIFFPLIISAYGNERFGLLTLAWALVGYFSLFDLGLSRALTQQVSAFLAANRSQTAVAELVRTGLGLMAILGLAGGLVLWLLTPHIVSGGLHLSHALEGEVVQSFSILALSIPMVVHTSGLRGVLESLHRFKAASLIRMVMGVGTFLGPYLATLFSNSLVDAIWALIIVRLIVWVMHVVSVHQSGILNHPSRSFNAQYLPALFKFGGWLTLSNIVGPVMVYLDRFLIVSWLGAASVAFYVAPYEVITKLWVVPAAIAGVLFPVFAQQAEGTSVNTINMLVRGARYVLLLLYPACLILIVFSKEWLDIWLGSDFSISSPPVVTWLIAGILINSVAQVVYAKVQGIGRSDLTAKLHLIEVPIYLLSIWVLVENYGLQGAAMAWFLRVSIDFFGLVFYVLKFHPKYNDQVLRMSALTLIAVASLLVEGMLTFASMKLSFLVAFGGYYVWLAYKQIRSDGYIARAQDYLKAFNK